MADEVSELFDAVADLTPSGRAEYYRNNGVPEELRREVESLLEHEQGASGLLAGGFSEVAGHAMAFAGEWDRPPLCGPFRPVQLLGRGGMGVVWLAERTDGEIQQRVALKLLRAESGTLRFRQRFLQERQILSTLSHPNIARLLDAGHSVAGQPYLVIEYIDGRPIDHYALQLDLNRKLRLFLKICAAVSYAHRNLVIHRDLKPSNVLVTPEGDPKLLDFGIAKLVNLEGDRTTTIERMLTPDYASPEQVTGASTGTATDIYSLGAILYKLLTGRSPHKFEDASQVNLAAVICHREPLLPSSLVPNLKGDLDFILLKALRKEPDQRYGSADQLAEDIENFLAHRPVRARSGSLWYRARRFLRRYWLPAAAAAAAVVGLAAGLIVAEGQRRQAEMARAAAERGRLESQRQSERADRERAEAARQENLARGQHEEAQRQRDLAENRFQQVRGLAGRLMDLDKEIRGLAGATKARQSLVNTALAHLEKLSAGAGGDPAFQLELANTYFQVAAVQSGPGLPNLSQPEEALKSLGKAESLLAGILDRDPRHGGALPKMAEIIDTRSRILATAQNWTAAAREAERGFQYLGRLPAEVRHQDDMLAFAATMAQSAQGIYLNLDRLEEALRHGRRAIDLRRQLWLRTRRPVEETVLATAMLQLAIALRYNGALEEALRVAREGRQIFERQYQPDSSEWPTTRRLLYGLFHEARILGSPDSVSLGRWDEADELLQRAIHHARRLASADAKDLAVRHQLALAASQLAMIRMARDPESALALFDEAFRSRSEIPSTHSNHLDKLHEMAGSIQALRKLGRREEAARRTDQLFTFLSDYKLYPGEIKLRGWAEVALRARADLLADAGDLKAAIAQYQEIVAAIEAGSRKPAEDLHWALAFSEIYERLESLFRQSSDTANASLWRARRASLWQDWERKLPGNPFVGRQLTMLNPP